MNLNDLTRLTEKMCIRDRNKKADYVITGQWAKKAAAEAERYITVNRVASSADKTFS